MNNSLVYIDYYIGIDGGTIKIATRNKGWIQLLREQVAAIFNGDIQSFDICQMPDVECSDSISSLELIRVKKSSVPCVIWNRLDEKNIFKWRQDIEEIETLLWFIDPLVSSSHPCHQYIADSGCVIKLSYNED